MVWVRVGVGDTSRALRGDIDGALRVGGAMASPFRNEYVDLSSNVKGAFCKACPSPATSKVAPAITLSRVRGRLRCLWLTTKSKATPRGVVSRWNQGAHMGIT